MIFCQKQQLGTIPHPPTPPASLLLKNLPTSSFDRALITLQQEFGSFFLHGFSYSEQSEQQSAD